MEEYKPCHKRTSLVMFNADGTSGRVKRCTHQEAPKANQDVTPEDCSVCPVRQHIVNEERAKRPVKKLSDSTPILSRKADSQPSGSFPPCVDRLLVTVPLCCGKTTDKRLCDSIDSPSYQGEVSPITCTQCKVRRT